MKDKETKQDLKDLKKEFVSKKEIELMIENAILKVKSKSQSQQVSPSIKKSQGRIETKLINTIKRSKKALVIAEINKLAPSMTTIEMYDKLVLEKGLCSKASFYRYVESLKSQKSHNLIETKTRSDPPIFL